MIFGGYDLKKLVAETEILPFRCTDEDLNDFLLTDAKKYYMEFLATTYLIEDSACGRTVAYFSLLNDSLTSDLSDHREWNKLSRPIANSKRRRQYPAVKIGRLAVSEEYKCKGIGKDILTFVMFMLTYGSPTACRFVTVDAYRDAVGFYEKFGFRILLAKEDSVTYSMYFDLKNFQKGLK